MKKILLFVITVFLMLMLSACAKMCHECGKITNNGYTVFGNYYCEDCFW